MRVKKEAGKEGRVREGGGGRRVNDRDRSGEVLP